MSVINPPTLPTSTPLQVTLQGVRAILPILLGIVPFALIAGIGAANAGLTAAEGMGMSGILFAGAAQLVVLQLYVENTPALVVIFTAFIVNLRFMIYSASLAPHLKKASTVAKSVLAYMLTDQAYAVSIMEFDQNAEREHKAWFYFGTAFTIWVVWQACNALGIFLGAAVPAAWGLDFAIPLTFLALLVPALKDRPAIWAALSAGFIATVFFNLRFNFGLPLAVFSGIAVGMLSEGGTKEGAK